jgi:hypothetical protein
MSDEYSSYSQSNVIRTYARWVRRQRSCHRGPPDDKVWCRLSPGNFHLSSSLQRVAAYECTIDQRPKTSSQPAHFLLNLPGDEVYFIVLRAVKDDPAIADDGQRGQLFFNQSNSTLS